MQEDQVRPIPEDYDILEKSLNDAREPIARKIGFIAITFSVILCAVALSVTDFWKQAIGFHQNWRNF
jgi:hypothetical protein